MRINLSSRHFRASENLKSFAKDEVMRLKKYYDGIIDCEIILEKQKDIRTCEIVAKVYGTVLTTSVESHDHFKSIVMAVDKIEQQLRKYKAKIRNPRSKRTEEKVMYS
ncbi:ribosome-associated translation inhibitor RaiA [bacterium]|nr:ribosome-associated translation inhibitor RaiA [FCB group bacterium]MBL7192186.1 ribosome-associated translation inhibitor RaiA [bacterium]